MASFRALRPLARSISRSPCITQPSKRYLNWSSDPAFYTAHAQVYGGREGKVTSDGLNVKLAPPKAMGGPGGATNPEEMFAAGYGACFQGAMGVTAPTLNIKLPKNPEDIVCETDVHLIGDIKKLDIGIRVDMKIRGRNISKEDLEKLVEATKKVCPYSRATQGNVITNTSVEMM